jgi:hypothetical protein
MRSSLAVQKKEPKSIADDLAIISVIPFGGEKYSPFNAKAERNRVGRDYPSGFRVSKGRIGFD